MRCRRFRRITLVQLFNGQNFTGFEILLKEHGINNDPNKVFRIEDGVLHITGEEFGGLVTKKQYANYYLRAEFRWGEKTYPPRVGTARDSGIQYNVTGTLKVWPRMMEFQINEGGTGDMWVVNGTGPHFGRGPFVNVIGQRDPVNDLEKPHGEWNLLELVVDRDRILYLVNGKLALAGIHANTTRGKILFQCEGSEVYFRHMQIAQLK